MTSFENSITTLVQILADNRLMRTQEEVDKFIAALNKLELKETTYFKPDYLEMLFDCFDDSTEHIPPMQHLVNYVNGFDPEILAKTLLKITSKHIDRASWWLEHLYLRLLVSPDAEDVLHREYQALEAAQKPFIETMLWRVLEWGKDNREMYDDLETKIRDVLR